MIDKKKLIEELLDCVSDATDTETQITSLTMAGMLMNEVIDEALTIPAVVGRSEQLPTDIEIEKSRIEGVLLGLKICKEMWAQGRISHEEIVENEIYYKEELLKAKS